MRGYVALSGRDGAFGWCKKTNDGGWLVSFGGLQAGERYSLSEDECITLDEKGCWQGRLLHAPRYAALRGRVILWDENSISLEEAALLARPKEKKHEVHAVMQEEKTEEAKESVVYRTRLNQRSVAELPRLVWPKQLEKIKACFAQGIPVRVLSYPWRFVRVLGMQGEYLIGCLAENDRIVKTAYAVRAKGGLLQPKGLNGYDYVRTDAGENYWMLIQSVR